MLSLNINNLLSVSFLQTLPNSIIDFIFSLCDIAFKDTAILSTFQLMNEIIPNLYIAGIYDIAHNFDTKIKRVVNCTKELQNAFNIPDEDYIQLGLDDSGSFEDELLFYQSIKKFLSFMEEKPLKTHPVL